MTLKEEKKLWQKGYRFVAGLDEAGRGALAGPVTAAAVVILNYKSSFHFDSQSDPGRQRKASRQFTKLKKEANDSKKLRPKKREELFEIITRHPQILWSIAKVGPKIIDKINIFNASKLAMEKTVKNLNLKLKNARPPRFANPYWRENCKIEFLLLDGNFKIYGKQVKNLPQKPIVKGDGKVLSCALASILAKVFRDRIMQNYDKFYPEYGFAKHKGYPSEYHKSVLAKIGSCKIHRKTFGPVKIVNSKS